MTRKDCSTYHIANLDTLFLVTTHHRCNCRTHIIHLGVSNSTPFNFTPSSVPPPLPSLLALHIRRGDYMELCKRLASWSSRFMAFYEFPGLPDRFPPPAVHSQGIAPPEEDACYLARCFPEIEQIVSRVREVRAPLLLTTTLTRIYMLTNGWPWWLQ